MLREIAHTRQRSQESARRWFTDHNMDLMIWYDGDEILSFQLSYQYLGNEKICVWKRNHEVCLHQSVDSGFYPGKHKGSPLIFGSNQAPEPEILNLFKQNCRRLDGALADFVIRHLNEAMVTSELTSEAH